MNILITGGAGFIGSALAEVLVKDGHDVKVLDNFFLGSTENLSNILDKIDLINGDIRDQDLVAKATNGVDIIFHEASPSSFLHFEEDSTLSTDVTIKGFINILECARKFDIEKIVYASTSAVYEGNPLPYHEEMALCPPDLKALTKKFNEEMARSYSERYGIKTIGLRPFSVYGFHEKSKRGYANVISLFLWTMGKGERPVVWGDGTQTRDFIFVDDVVEAYLLAMQKDYLNEVFNVGTGKETSFNEVIQLINRCLGTNLEPIYVPVPYSIYAIRLLADTTKAEKMLGFKAKISVEEGIEKLARYYNFIKPKNVVDASEH